MNPTLDQLLRPVQARRPRMRRRSAAAGHHQSRAHRRPWRLRRRRHHLDGDPAARARAARRRCRPFHSRTPDRRLRPPARHHRSAPCRRREADRLGRLRHSRAEAARRARELGVDLIITDHHEPDDELPDACAVVNPKRHDCNYPDKNLAGVGVALKLVQALCGRAGKSAWLPAFVKIASIGTLADVVPLVGENRIIAKLGLQMLTKGPHKVGPARAARSRGSQRQDHRQLSHRLHGGAAHQRRRPHEHAGHRDEVAARVGRGHGGRGEGARRTARSRKHPPAPGGSGHPRQGEEDRRDRSGDRLAKRPRRRRRGLAPRRDRHRRLEAGRRVLSARRSCCRSTATSRTGPAAASPASTCSRASNRARR